MIEPSAVASVGTGLHAPHATELCVCGLRASVRVWASECPSAPRRRVDESRQLCPRCAAIARGEKAPLVCASPTAPIGDEPGRAASKSGGRPISRMTIRSRILLALADGHSIAGLSTVLGTSTGCSVYGARRAGLINDRGLTSAGWARVAELRSIDSTSPGASCGSSPGAPPAPAVVAGAGASLRRGAA